MSYTTSEVLKVQDNQIKNKFFVYFYFLTYLMYG